MKLTNKQIYNYAQNLIDFNKENYSFPLVVNFYIQKNIQEIEKFAEDIENARVFIVKKYGKLQEDQENVYSIEPEYIEKAQNELDQLLNLEQMVNIHMIKLSDLTEVQIDTKQLNAILFMIEDDLSETKEDN